jgi:hypothetical protein
VLVEAARRFEHRLAALAAADAEGGLLDVSTCITVRICPPHRPQVIVAAVA